MTARGLHLMNEWIVDDCLGYFEIRKECELMLNR
jgi:hypothetical protein